VLASNPGGYGNELALQHMNGMEMNMHFNSNLQHMLQMGYSNNIMNGAPLNPKGLRKDCGGQLSNQSLHHKSLQNGHIPNVLIGPGTGNYKHVIPIHD